MKKIEKIINKCLILFLPIFLSSCYVGKYVDYGITAKNKDAIVDKNNFSVEYPQFNIRYNTNGNCRIENRSDSLMIVDLGSSYLADGENLRRLYSNAVTTVTNTQSTTSGSGASVGLGGVARALGAGRVTQSIANGVTVGGGSANTNTNTTSTYYQQEQYIFIPANGIGTVDFELPHVPYYNGKCGEYECDNSIEQVIAYSFDPDGTKFQTFHNEITVDKVVVLKNKQMSSIPTKKYRKFGQEKNEAKTVGAIVGGTIGGVGAYLAILLPLLLLL